MTSIGVLLSHPLNLTAHLTKRVGFKKQVDSTLKGKLMRVIFFPFPIFVHTFRKKSKISWSCSICNQKKSILGGGRSSRIWKIGMTSFSDNPIICVTIDYCLLSRPLTKIYILFNIGISDSTLNPLVSIANF